MLSGKRCSVGDELVTCLEKYTDPICDKHGLSFLGERKKNGENSLRVTNIAKTGFPTLCQISSRIFVGHEYQF